MYQFSRAVIKLPSLLVATVLLSISQLCVADLKEFDAMICKLQVNVAEGAAKDRIQGLSIEESIASTNQKLRAFDGQNNDLTKTLKEVMRGKVIDVYNFYSLEFIQKPNFRSFMHGLCLSDALPKLDSSLSVDYRFVDKMSNTFKIVLAGSIPQKLLEKVSMAAATCMLTEYRSENHAAIDEFMTYIANGVSIGDAQKRIMKSYIEDEKAVAAFRRVATSSKDCLENTIRSFAKR